MVSRRRTRELLMTISRRRLGVTLPGVMRNPASMRHPGHVTPARNGSAGSLLARGLGFFLLLVLIGLNIRNEGEQGEKAETFFHRRISSAADCNRQQPG